MTSFSAQTDAVLKRLGEAQTALEASWIEQIEAYAPPAFAALFGSLAATLFDDPKAFRDIHARYYRDQLALWREILASPPSDARVPEEERDPRFSAPEWRAIPWFSFLRRNYALTANWLAELIDLAHADPATQRKLRFYGRQFIAAAAPSNFALTNPEVIKLALATRGESLAQGLKNLQADADKGRMSMTDEAAFEVGRNLALTPGAVVFRNELIELIQYRPTRATVYARPVLIVPPFINKYYILDLRPENSFVRHALDCGLNVFLVSWRNVPAALGALSWNDYIEQGALAAIGAVRDICARRKVGALGFCVGGTLLACALAVLRRRGERPAASLTLLASMLDFSDPGDIGVYVDAAYVARCEQELGRGGVFAGARLAQAFASLRPNDLIWRYVVENYLKGRSPPAFDLLYWNSDSANLPGPLYAYYLRHMYLENALREPGRLSMCGVAVDLGTIGIPSYVLAAADDHIVPWRTAYASARLLGTDVTFVRAASGHIAGVVSPPGQRRRSYRTGALATDPDAWLESSRSHEGSWWPDWIAWITKRSGSRIGAPMRLGNARHPELDPAPGRYVRERAAAAASPAPSPTE